MLQKIPSESPSKLVVRPTFPFVIQIFTPLFGGVKSNFSVERGCMIITHKHVILHFKFYPKFYPYFPYVLP